MSRHAPPYPGPSPGANAGLLPVTTQVPLSTMLADLDATLTALLRRELDRHGLDRVNVAFDAPTRDWAAALSTPTVSVFLYDLRESAHHTAMDWQPQLRGDRRIDERPPLLIDVSFGISAWTREIEDEHRLLSQVLSILYAYPQLGPDDLVGTLRSQPIDRFPIHTRLAASREGPHGWWGSMGGAHKASIDYRVSLAALAGTFVERGPETRAPTIRMQERDGPRGHIDERTSAAGAVRDPTGKPVADTWVLLPDIGTMAVTDGDGRYRFSSVPNGRHRIVARTPAGERIETSFEIPGAPADLVVGAGPGAGVPNGGVRTGRVL